MDYSEFLPVPALAMKKLSYPNLRQLGRILIGAPDFCQCFFPEMERARKIPPEKTICHINVGPLASSIFLDGWLPTMDEPTND